MMTRQIKALQLSCGIHAILVFALISATQTVSVPSRIDLMDFTLLNASGLEIDGPTTPDTGKTAAPETRSEELAAASNPPPIIEQPRLKVEAPQQETLLAEKPQAEPALAEEIVQEETAATETEPKTTTVLQNPVTSTADLSEPTPSSPPPLAAVAQAASRGALTEQPSQTSQEQYLTNHFAGIRKRILRYLRYPAVARKKGWSGQVRLSFHIDHEGGVENITVLTSSGYDLLDRQAISVVRQVAPYPQPLENVEVTMPITFSLSK